MRHLARSDLDRWLAAITHPLARPDALLAWLEGPLRTFFPFKGLALGHGELVAGELRVTHLLTIGHEEEYLRQLATTFELPQRGSLQWWFAHRSPFVIDPRAPPAHASRFEIDEIDRFNLRNVAGHGVLNAKSNAGTYFGFAGVKEPLSEWHLEALRLMAPVLNDLLLAHIATKEAPPIHVRVKELSPRQQAIVRRVVDGLHDKRIAAELGISEKTVRNQLTAIYTRIGVHKRTQLIALFR